MILIFRVYRKALRRDLLIHFFHMYVSRLIQSRFFQRVEVMRGQMADIARLHGKTGMTSMPRFPKWLKI